MSGPHAWFTASTVDWPAFSKLRWSLYVAPLGVSTGSA
jgi:hypothetical protein